MAIYAISQEGANQIRALAKSLYISANNILESNRRLRLNIDACGNGLGVYESQILTIVEKNSNTLKTNHNNIEELVELLRKKALEIEDLISLIEGTGDSGSSSQRDLVLRRTR